MLIVNRLGGDAGRYYLPGPVEGRWCGAGRHDLGLDGVVRAGDLDAVLRGRRPGDGLALSARNVAHRQGGWDLIFTAPKSVSLLAASAPDSGEIAAAHLRACADAFVWLERHAAWARRRNALVETSGFVAARFGHELSAGGEPHLHTHVLIANAVRGGDGAWSAVDGSAMWLNRRGVAAAYHLGLRRQLALAGIRPAWVLHDDGTADIASVPRPAIEATSSRRRAILARLAADTDASPHQRVAAQRTTRDGRPGPTEPRTVRRPAPETGVEDRSWRSRAATAGFGPTEAAAVLAEARRPARVPDADPGRLSSHVVAWLDRRRSTFGVVDVMQALAATHPAGASPHEVGQWAETFVAGSPRAPDGRWTSGLSMARDAGLAAAATARARTGVAAVAPDVARRSGLPPAVARLVGNGNGVDVVGGPTSDPAAWPVTRAQGGFVAQAALLDRARRVWERDGRTVAVDAPGPAAGRRWRALSGIDARSRTDPWPDVLVVDRADRHTSSELSTLLDEAGRVGTKVVLVLGGTLPARRAAISQGLEQAALVLDPIRPEAGAPDLRAGRAIDTVVATWHAERARGTGARMVGLGPAECDELNRRARDGLRAARALGDDEVVVAGRPFAAGDEVVTTRRGSLPAGTVGRVQRVDRKGTLELSWAGGLAELDRRSGRSLRHAYAVPPGMLRFDSAPLIVLGRAADLGRHAQRVVGHALVAGDQERTRDLPPRREQVHDRERARGRDVGLGL